MEVMLTTWYRTHNLILNVDKTKEMVIDFRRAGKHHHTSLQINGTAVERASSVKFLGVHLADNVTWTSNTTAAIKRAQKQLHPLQRLRKAGLPTVHLTIFYRGTTENTLTYSFTSWFGSCILLTSAKFFPCLSFKHYILAFGGILAIPLILAKPLCIKDNNAAKSQLISTIFFVSGICTMLQTTIGTRLTILQGGMFTFITPMLAILALPKWKCPKGSMTPDFNATVAAVSHIDPEEMWKIHIQEIQGAILVASLLQVMLGLSGLVGFVLKFIGPLTIIPTINLIGLSLFIQAGKKSGGHWGISALTVFLILLFSQYLSKVKVPLVAYKDKKWKVFHYPLFSLFSALFGMTGAWLVCFLLTYFDVLPTSPHEYSYQAWTDINLDAVSSAEWFFMPYPGQWGLPTVSVSSILGMMARALASTMESIGDYYACACLSGAPTLPTHAFNHGIAVEGLGCILAGLWGSGNRTTSYSQNIAALGITRVGSRLVLQTAGLLMVLLELFGKLSTVFITILELVIGGMFLVMFGMVAAVGISNLQYVDLNSSRNLLICGVSVFTGLVLPSWFHSNPDTISTGITELDQLITVLFTTPMFISGFLRFILDNTIPGTDEEQGMKHWRKTIDGSASTTISTLCYDLPLCMNSLHKFWFL
ncbi:solute carrier family 23 member 1 [Neoarius graeffei]|uniref:solute carrier family 23 member 1 n=1 Tax=Neoarius graeffei TaxID=443677 RepID=UPI00298C5002|nr:solute carrier family 23 member 1 [Neoarius graeffei]